MDKSVKSQNEGQQNNSSAFTVVPLEKQFELISRNVTRIRHALMDETARRHILEKFLQKNRAENCQLRKRIDALRQSTNRDHDKEAHLAKEIFEQKQVIVEQKKAHSKLVRQLSEQRSQFNRVNMKLDSLEREKALLERTKIRMESAVTSLKEENDQHQRKLESQASERVQE